MKKKADFISWVPIQERLKQKYPQLTDADLVWRNGLKEDMFIILAEELGISVKELKRSLETVIDHDDNEKKSRYDKKR